MSRLAIEIDGFPELLNKIKQLSDDKDKRRETLALLREVTKPTLQAARLLTPVQKGYARTSLKSKKSIVPGTLKKSIGIINVPKSENPQVVIGPRVKGSFNGAASGWYGLIVHGGRNFYKKGFKRKHKKGANNGAAVSRYKGNPFLTKAYQATGGRVTADAEVKMARFIQRRIDKLS